MDRSGYARERNGLFYASVRYGRAKRLEFRVRWAKNAEEARARADLIAKVSDRYVEIGRRDLVLKRSREIARAAPKQLPEVMKAIDRELRDPALTAPTSDITFGEWARRFTSGELSEAYPDHVRRKDWSDDRSRLKKYVLPRVGDVPISAFTLAHAQRVMAKLPKMSVANRRHVAQIMGRLLRLAVMPGQLIPTTPLPSGWLPKVQTRHHYSCMYPREEAMLLAHTDTNEAFRLFCGVLNREGMRLSELLDSEWWQWNLDEGTFTTTRTKTHDPRMWAVRPDVADAMRIWKHAHAGARPFAAVIALGDRTKLAVRLRTALKAAGVQRGELFDNTEHTRKLRAHDMRATFVTISLAEGRSETWIRDRTAHRSTAMIDRYRRHARQLAELRVGPLVDLVDVLGWTRPAAPGGAGEGGGGYLADQGSKNGSSEEAQVLESTEGGTRTLTSKGRRILNAPTRIEGSRDGVNNGGSRRSEASRNDNPPPIRHPLSRPGDTRAAEHVESSSAPPARLRVEVDGVTVAEVSGSPRKLARATARGLRRAGFPAVAHGSRVVVGGVN